MAEEQNIESNENVKAFENLVKNTHTISVDLNKEQYDFLVKWQKEHESELGIDVPLGSMVRKSVDIAMKSQNKKEDSDRKPGGFGDRKPGGFSDRKPGGFGDRKPGGFGERRSGPRTSLLPKSPRRF